MALGGIMLIGRKLGISSVRSAIFLAILIMLGIAGNVGGFPLFPGVNLLFGSIAVLLVIGLYGVFWGVVAATVSYGFAFFWLREFCPLIIGILEAVFVGIHFRRKNENLVLADGLFWFFLGLPLGWLVNYFLLHLNLDEILVVTLKFGVNGIFNALVASLILNHLPLSRWVFNSEEKGTVSFYQTVFNLLMAFILIPALIFTAVNNNRQQRQFTAGTKIHIIGEAKEIVAHLITWRHEHQHALNSLGKIALQSNMQPTKELQKATEQIKDSFTYFDRVHVDNIEATAITFAPYRENGKLSLGTNFADRQHYKDMRATLKPVISDVLLARVGNAKPVVIMGVPIVEKDKLRGFVAGALNLGYISDLLITTRHSDEMDITLLDRNNKVIASTRPALRPMQRYKPKLAEKNLPANNVYHWLPPDDGKLTELARWQNSCYVYESSVAPDIPWKLAIEIPFAPYLKEMLHNTTDYLAGMLGFTLVAFLLGSLLSKHLTGPLAKLASVTTDLPCRISNREEIKWPYSPFTEMNSLVVNFRSMAGKLQQNFLELQQARMKAEEEKNKIEAIVAGIGDGISIQDTNYRVIFQNRIQRELMGEAVGQYCYQAYEGRDQVCPGCPVAVSLQEGTIQTVERCPELKKGSLYIEVTSAPLKDAAGKITGAIEVVRDITERKKTEELLRQQSAAMRASMDGMAILNTNGEYIYMNEAHARIYGYANPAQLIGKTWHILYDEEERDRFEKEVLPALYKQGYIRTEAVGRKADGSLFPQEVSLTLIEGGGTVCVVRDITERKQAEQAIWEEKERAQVTLHSIGDAVITTDGQGIITYLNPVAEVLTGWTNDEACGRPLLEVFNIINETTGQVVENPVTKCLREGNIVGLANHTVLIHRSGRRYAIEDSAAPIKNREGEIIGVVLVFHDVSEKRNMIEQLTHQAYHDPLTDIPNRVLFNDRLNVALAHAKRNNEMLAVMFLDLDRFKLVNDMLGHSIGDRLLQEVAKKLSICLRKGDTIARLGGDEFTLLLPQIKSEKEAAKIAQKILKAFQKPVTLSGHEFYITASIGVALYPSDGEKAEILMKNADTAMYRAKEQGRNTYQLYTPAMNKKIVERMAMENSLRHALERRELVVYYQPLVCIRTGRITGMEALIRWRHKELGLVPPAEFIPLAEETGLIIPIGEWVLRTACAQNKAWQDAGYMPVRVTVNLSAYQFQHQNLVNTVAKTLKQTGLHPQYLELEITESIAMQDVDYTVDVLRKLREMGVQIAIDDFGTGYSSLRYLKRFPINTLKIDRSFVRDIACDPNDAAIVSTIIVLCRNMNLKVIAEGVETEEQLNFLKNQHCYEMQGYFFSQPVPEKEFEELLKRYNMP